MHLTPAPADARATARSRRALTLAALAPLLAAPALLGAGPALAASGDLDPTFSGDGVAVLAAGAGSATAAAQQKDGRTLVAGNGHSADGTPALQGTYVARYLPTGELDPAFGVGGVAKVNVMPGAETVRDVVVDGAGRVLVAGWGDPYDAVDYSDGFVLRLTPSGAVDTAFGGGGTGIARFDLSDHERQAGLAVSGSRILVGSSQDTGGNWTRQWTVLALTAGGAVDTAFSGDGRAEVPTTLLDTADALRDLLVQPDGKVLLGGSSGWSFAVARMTASGALDGTWSGDGVATTQVEAGGAGLGLALQSDRKVVLVGTATVAGRTDEDMAAVRFTGTGALDPTFSGDGRAVFDGGARATEQALSVVQTADSKLVLGGHGYVGSSIDTAALRLNWNGTPDTSFSGDGQVRTSTLSTGVEGTSQVVLGAADRVLGVGSNAGGWTVLAYSGSAPSLAGIGDARVTEPDTGTVAARFPVTLSRASATPVTVRWAVTAGTASSPADVAAASGTVTFAAGTTRAEVAVPVVGDTLDETDETFTVRLSLPTNAGTGDALAVGTVVDDD